MDEADGYMDQSGGLPPVLSLKYATRRSWFAPTPGLSHLLQKNRPDRTGVFATRLAALTALLPPRKSTISGLGFLEEGSNFELDPFCRTVVLS
jgi:hypothetical protein